MAISGRVYTASFTNVTISAAQDIFMLTTSASRMIAILSVNLGQQTATSIANQRLRLQRLNSTVVGSGGATVTATPWVLNDAASTTTVRANDTTQTTVTGVDLWDDQWNVLNGFLWIPPTPNRPPVIGPGQSFRVSLDTAPSSLVSEGSITFEELP